MAVRGSETVILPYNGGSKECAASLVEEKGEMDDVVGTP